MTTKKGPAKSQAKPRTTKKAQLIRMLSTKTGADVEAISRKFGWQNHTTRAAITGLKKAGYEISAEKEGGKPARYRITDEPQDTAGAGPETAVEIEAAPEPANAG